ncbi:hypothetical protein CAC42_5751 [Sphaceloma murrayae]|uniref:Defect at low temperature protein 1 n=1 Tax=Sphaceloma murrayae TaxID=2082308 RepID=A0A2K1QZ28_9PEZI|nr:hypothetical protein CAC42_5751 [Sphaceloma murrayae]
MARRFRLPFRIPILRVFYSTTYTALFLLELLLLAITPTALIYSAITEKALQYIVIVGGVYTLVAILVLFIYSSRLFTNRTVLAALGKSYIPIEEGEVSGSVRKLIKGQLQRSANIALECRPRDLSSTALLTDHQQGDEFAQNEKTRVGQIARVDPNFPPWGLVKHPGWSSPNPSETSITPHVFFLQIIDELPNLLEARIVSLGGPPRSSDIKAVTESEYPGSQKPPLLDIRGYLTYVDAEGSVSIPSSAESFIDRFEKARFCGRPLHETELVELTSTFADLLSNTRTGDGDIDTPFEIRNSPLGATNGLPVIRDDASFLSGTSRSSRSTDLRPQTSNRELRGADVESPTSAAGGHEHRGSVVHVNRAGAVYGGTGSSGPASTATLDSMSSVIQQARSQRRRRHNL